MDSQRPSYYMRSAPPDGPEPRPLSAEEQKRLEAQRMTGVVVAFMVVLTALLFMGLWCVAAGILVPLRGDETGAALAERYLLLSFGAVVIAGSAVTGFLIALRSSQ